AVHAHPQGFQLDKDSNRIYANIPKKQAIVVLDYVAGNIISTWQTGNPSNFPLALHPAANHVVVVFRYPPKLVAFESDGTTVADAETCGDADDMFVDARRSRIYVSCGEGFIDVLDTARYQRVARIATIRGARTSLFVPEIDRLFVAARATP